jgi:hypothetical protein
MEMERTGLFRCTSAEEGGLDAHAARWSLE